MRKIYKYFKRIFILIIVLLAILAGSLFVIGTYYADETEQLIVSEINKTLNIEISVKDVELSLFSNFPNASLDFTELQTKEQTGSNSNALLNAKKVALLFNVYDIITRNYKIERILLKDAFLNIIVHEDGTNNLMVNRKSDNTESGNVNIDLQEVILRNVEISYLNYPSDQEYLVTVNKGDLKGIFTSENFEMEISGDLFSKHIRSGKHLFFKDRQLKTQLKLAIDKNEQSYLINQGLIESAGLLFDITGSVNADKSNRYLDLKIQAHKSSLQSFLQLVPNTYLEPIKDYQLKGDLNFTAALKGDFSGNKLPLITFNFGLEDGTINHSKSGLNFQHVSFTGNFQNGKSKSKKSFSVKLTDFETELYSSKINGSLQIVNFEHPTIVASFKSSADLKEVKKIFHIDNLQSISGKLNIDMQFKNTLKSFRQFTISDFISSNTSGLLEIKDVNIQFKNSPIQYKQLNGDFKFSNKDLEVSQFTGRFAESDFGMKGYFINALAFLFLPEQKIKIKADFKSDNLKLGNLLKSNQDEGGSAYRLQFSKNINFDLNLDLNNFSFNKFTAQNLRGKVVMYNQKLTISNATLVSMDGKSSLAGIIDGTNPERFWLDCEATLTNVDINKLFYQFGNFGQKSISSENIRGIVNAQIIYQSYISSALKIDPASVYTVGDIKIKEGELVDFKPMYKLSKFLKNKELERVQFSTLENQIKIKDQVVTIPEMDIASNTLDLKINGTHSFQNDVDYHIQVLLSELISRNRFKEEDIEGIFTEDDGLGKTTLFLKMTGNANDPDIKYDTKEVRKKIAKDLKNERNEIKEAFNKEFGKRENSTETDELDLIEETQSDQSFIIEWEEDEQKNDSLNMKTPSQKSKPKKKDKKQDSNEFIILWDEENDTIK